MVVKLETKPTRAIINNELFEKLATNNEIPMLHILDTNEKKKWAVNSFHLSLKAAISISYPINLINRKLLKSLLPINYLISSHILYSDKFRADIGLGVELSLKRRVGVDFSKHVPLLCLLL